MGLFSKTKAVATAPLSKEFGRLKPGLALPHITLPTTEVCAAVPAGAARLELNAAEGGSRHTSKMVQHCRPAHP